jgi:hypothetical protein
MNSVEMNQTSKLSDFLQEIKTRQVSIDEAYAKKKSEILDNLTRSSQSELMTLTEKFNTELIRQENELLLAYEQQLSIIHNHYQKKMEDLQTESIGIEDVNLSAVVEDEPLEALKWGNRYLSFNDEAPYSLGYALDVLSSAGEWDHEHQPRMSQFNSAVYQVLEILSQEESPESGQTLTYEDVLHVAFELTSLVEPSLALRLTVLLDDKKQDEQVNQLLLINLLTIFDGLGEDVYSTSWQSTETHRSIQEYFSSYSEKKSNFTDDGDGFVTPQGVVLAGLIEKMGIILPDVIGEEVAELTSEVVNEY